MARSRTRRDFLKTTAAAGSLAMLSADDVLGTLQNGIFIRRNLRTLNANSPDIISLKAGINAMKALPASNPLSWNTWANIHGSPSGTGPLWNSCQHGHWWFLPWHRMYLLFFERIIRKLSNNPSFSLPYWDYAASGMAGNTYPAGALPLIFRQPTAGNALFVSQRNAGINAGQSISPASTSNATAFTFVNFFGPQGTSASFGSQQLPATNHAAQPHGRLESTPHDTVHGAIGGFMGSFGTAARDPIFWMHHSNIDRLWNLWLTLGGNRRDPNNSTWCRQAFTFFNENGQQVRMMVRDVINAQAQLKYRYEGEPALIPTQSCPTALTAAPALPPLQLTARTLATKEGAVTLGASPVRIPIRLTAARQRARGIAADAQRTLVLRIEGIKVTTHPGVVYEVYVGLPEGQKPVHTSPFFVGVFSTFGADHAGPEGHTVAMPIDAAAGRVLQQGSGDNVPITIVPRGLYAGDVEQPARPQGQVTFARVRVIEE